MQAHHFILFQIKTEKTEKELRSIKNTRKEEEKEEEEDFEPPQVNLPYKIVAIRFHQICLFEYEHAFS